MTNSLASKTVCFILCRPITYDALLTAIVLPSPTAAHVKVDPALLTAQQPGAATSSSHTPSLPTTSAQAKKKYHLKSSSDPLFAQSRDLNFAIVGGKLNKEARRLDAEYKVTDFGCSLPACRTEFSLLQNRHNAQTVSQLRDFVGKLGGLQSEHQALRLRQ